MTDQYSLTGHLGTTSYEQYFARASASMEDSDIASFPGFGSPRVPEVPPDFPAKSSSENSSMLPGFLQALTRALSLQGMQSSLLGPIGSTYTRCTSR